jgi:Protein of unknown function (DUF4197)
MLRKLVWSLLKSWNNSDVIPAKLATASASRNPANQILLDARFRGHDVIEAPTSFAGFRDSTLVVVAVLLILANPAWAQFDKVLRDLGGAIGSSDRMSEVKIGSGLQEALKIGTENAVLQTGRIDGFFKNKFIKILMPKPLQTIEQPLRLVGYGPQIDEFVLSMNRAAEKAVPFAKQIFWDAIGQMTFDDARKILAGNDTAATDYFKVKTSPKLHAAFQPTVENVMNEVGVTRQYNELIGRYKSVPFAQSVTFDINGYVTEKTTDGLFFVVGQEEKKIRTNPSARVTDLLKEVFGGRK